MKKVCIYSIQSFELPLYQNAVDNDIELVFRKEALSLSTVSFAAGCDGVALFTSDDCSSEVLTALKNAGVKFVVTRSAGYDHINLAAAKQQGIKVANVPAYSPNAVAEHSLALMLNLSRKLTRSNFKVHQYDFTIDDLVGFNLAGKTVGVIGTGRIGAIAIKILHGLGCKILAHDLKQDEDLIQKFGVQYTSIEELCKSSDIISLYIPLTKDTEYLINDKVISLMKNGVMLINTSRGKVINTQHVLDGLAAGKIGYVGFDVYENEKGLFFHDFSKREFNDPLLKRLLENENVLVTAHHGFLTNEALRNIADATFYNMKCFVETAPCRNELHP